jgi:hypothetical protein
VSGGLLFAFWVALLGAVVPGAAWGETPEPGHPSESAGAIDRTGRPELSEVSEEELLEELLDEDTPMESRYFALADSLGTLLAAAPEDLDQVSRVEIDEIKAVAEELLLEGEVDIAATLMEGAILLLSEEEGME